MNDLPNSPRKLMRMVQVYKETQILFMAIKMNLFSYLTDFSYAEKLAQDLNWDTAEVKNCLERLVLAGLLEKQGNTYRNTPEAEQFLNCNSASYLGSYLRCWERNDCSVQLVGNKIK
ncbi:methyltransferase dimerization domain-containing protein [Anaerospora hongkongensis]|uniref:methyltransferase family protein n=1 Tax=Anaerospora hongkongensis TaxID=244830 RepID=UPI00289ED101|nr:methyltransferase dimerization domain-containing protein [Anaerospora hongkongensis]